MRNLALFDDIAHFLRSQDETKLGEFIRDYMDFEDLTNEEFIAEYKEYALGDLDEQSIIEWWFDHFNQDEWRSDKIHVETVDYIGRTKFMILRGDF